MKVSPVSFDPSVNYKASIYSPSGDSYVSRGSLVKSGIPFILTDLTATTAERVLRERTEALGEYYFRASFRLEDVEGIIKEGYFVEVTHRRHPTLNRFVSLQNKRLFTVSYIIWTSPHPGLVDVILTLRSDT